MRARETDITIPIADLDKTITLARGWYEKGFRLFKMKVGKDVDGGTRRLESVHREFPGISFIGDGNQGFSRQECLTFAQGVKRFGGTMVLLEQPVVRDDLDTPLLLANDPVTSGYRYNGPCLQPWSKPGLDTTAEPPQSTTTIE